MIASALRRVQKVAEWVAAGLLAVLAVRFAWVAVAAARNESTPRVSRVPSADVTAPLHPLLSALLAPPPIPRDEEPRSQIAGPDAGLPIRALLVVTAGAPRSEILVNGVHTGNSPYVGDIACRRDDRVKIDVVPPKGVPLRFERICVDGTLRVGD